MAYVIGAYLGDGWTKSNGEFSFFSIDKELVVCMKYYVESFLGPTPEIRERIYSSGFGGKGARGWLYSFGCTDFCTWLRDISCNKAKVPSIIPVDIGELSKNFCEGFLDTEGWVSKTKKIKSNLGTHWYRAGVCNTNLDLLNGVVARLLILGITHNKLTVIRRPDREKAEYIYNLSLKDLIKSRINFRTNRKRERLQEYRSLNVTKPWNKGKTKQELVSLIGKDYMKRNDLLPSTTEG
jgi:hypothetical protein